MLMGISHADAGTDGKPNTQPGGNMTVQWDIKAEQSQVDANRWYVYVVVYINRYPDSQRLVSVLGSDWTYFYVLRSANEVSAFNNLMSKAAASPTWVTLPDTDLFRISSGRLQVKPDGKVSLENADYCITQPLLTYDRWAAQAKEQHLTGVKKRIPGDLAVSFDVDANGDVGLLFATGRLDAEGVERLRTCSKSIEAAAEERLLPRIRQLMANEKKTQQSAADNQQKADLLK